MRILLALATSWLAPATTETPRDLPAAAAAVESVDSLYGSLGLKGKLDRSVFVAAVHSLDQHRLARGVLAIADMSQPSTAKRLYVIDLRTHTVVLNTYVAHGQNSGLVTPTQFSNRTDSHQTSLGLYRVGATIRSPKHGPALLLDGLDQGINDRALSRELIIHGANYVSSEFISATGRLGRSWGCPAVPQAEMPHVIRFLADGGLLYIHGG